MIIYDYNEWVNKLEENNFSGRKFIYLPIFEKVKRYIDHPIIKLSEQEEKRLNYGAVCAVSYFYDSLEDVKKEIEKNLNCTNKDFYLFYCREYSSKYQLRFILRRKNDL